VYLSILFVLLIGVAIGLMLFFGRARKPASSGSDLKKEEMPFVFSSDKPFVAAHKTIKTVDIPSETPKPQLVKKEKPSPLPPKTIQPEMQKQEPLKEETPLKADAITKGPSKSDKPQSNQDNLDFDHLSDLIDDFFSEEKNSKDFS
jgi:hypothetical protein